MKIKYFAFLITGILAAGGFSVLAQEVKANSDKINVLPMEEIVPSYSGQQVSSESGLDEKRIMKIITEQMKQGNLSPDEVKNMVEYCIERMGNRLDTDTRKSTGLGCH